ncbi:hypothetical protein ACLOJK_021356 [Asimina triloba]
MKHGLYLRPKLALQASNVQDIARCVARECEGLPLTLKTVGAALRDVKEASEWKHALNQLKSSPFRIPNMQEEVFTRLKFSYDRLCNEKRRACFLYCSLYPEDYEINVDKVIRHWIWEGLIDEEGNMEDQINEGHVIVNGLNNPRFIVKAGTGLEEPLENGEWVGDVQRHMRVLIVLNLSCTNIKCLLNSLSDLVNLRVLLLSGCHYFSKMSSLANLKELRELDLSSTAISQLPLGMEGLVNLRFLSLSHTNNFKQSSQMMYNPYPLQEYSVLDEIPTSGRLAQLTLAISDLVTYTDYIKSRHTRKLRNFTLDVGGKRLRMCWRMSRLMNPCECSVYAKVSHNSTEENSFLLPANALGLCLDGWANLSLLSSLQVKQSIWSEENDSSLLNLLEGLSFSCLESLQVIFQGVAQHDSFQSLKSVITGYCPKLKYLYKAQMLKNLQNLEVIVVLQCDGMEELLLELHEVFNLQRICSKLLVCNSMGNIEISHCPKLKKISLYINKSPIRIEGWIKGERAWWEALEWDDPATKELLLPLVQEENDLLGAIRKLTKMKTRSGSTQQE